MATPSAPGIFPGRIPAPWRGGCRPRCPADPAASAASPGPSSRRGTGQPLDVREDLADREEADDQAEKSTPPTNAWNPRSAAWRRRRDPSRPSRPGGRRSCRRRSSGCRRWRCRRSDTGHQHQREVLGRAEGEGTLASAGASREAITLSVPAVNEEIVEIPRPGPRGPASPSRNRRSPRRRWWPCPGCSPRWRWWSRCTVPRSRSPLA